MVWFEKTFYVDRKVKFSTCYQHAFAEVFRMDYITDSNIINKKAHDVVLPFK
jgi:hypothetical protein